MGKNTPAAPDYTGAANAQGQASQQNLEQQTWANRPNSYTPWGSQTWEASPTWDPTSGQWINQWSQNTNLAQPLQDAATSQMNIQRDRSQMGEQLLGGASQQVQQGVDWGSLPQAGGGISSSPLAMNVNLSGAPGIPGQVGTQGVQNMAAPAGQIQTSLGSAGPIQSGIGVEQMQRDIPTTAGQYQQQAQDAIYGQMTSRLDPQWAKREESMQAQLLNQGLRPGDEAFTSAMQDFNLGRNDAYSSAMNNAIAQSGQEASRMFGIDLNRGQFGNQAALNQFGMGLQAGQFGNQAQQQQWNQNLGAGQFANAAQQQQYGQNMGAAQLYNQAGQQAFNQDLASNQFDLARHQAGTSDAFQQAAFQNQAAGQDLSMQQQQSAYQNQLRQQQIAEQMQRQGWNLNLINAALAGQQVGMPQMPNYSNAGVAQTPNYLGAAQAQYGAGLDQYNAQQMQQQGLLNGASNLLPFMF